MLFYPQERLALFIDGANLYSAARALGFDIDYKKLLTEFSKKGILVRAYYYTALLEDREFSPLRPLVDWLDYNGYTLVTKNAREYTDAAGRRKIKGNMDIEIAVDMMEIAPSVDHIVLFSGDGDFRKLVEAVQRRGRIGYVAQGVEGLVFQKNALFRDALSGDDVEHHLRFGGTVCAFVIERA